MPESPRWLLKAGRNEEALGRLRSNGDPEGEAATAEDEDIIVIVELEKVHSDRNSYCNMFWSKKEEVLRVGSEGVKNEAQPRYRTDREASGVRF